MKITIDTEDKSIQIDEPVSFKELADLVNELKLEDYELIPNGYNAHRKWNPWNPYDLPTSPSVPQQPMPVWYTTYSTNTTLK